MTTQNASSRQAKFAETNGRISALAKLFSPSAHNSKVQEDIDLAQFCQYSHQDHVDPNQSEYIALSEFLNVIGKR